MASARAGQVIPRSASAPVAITAADLLSALACLRHGQVMQRSCSAGEMSCPLVLRRSCLAAAALLRHLPARRASQIDPITALRETYAADHAEEAICGGQVALGRLFVQTSALSPKHSPLGQVASIPPLLLALMLSWGVLAVEVANAGATIASLLAWLVLACRSA